MTWRVIVLFCVSAVTALYEDHAGSVDWHRRFLGAVDFVVLDGASPQGCKRVLAASNSGVVAALDAANGDIIWRHVYENEGDGVIDAVLRSKWGLVTVSGGGRLLRSWDVSTGSLRWESLTGLERDDDQDTGSYPLTTEWRPGGVQATSIGTSLETIVVAMGTEVVGFKGRSGEKIWKTQLESDSTSLSSLLRPSLSDDTSLSIMSSSVETKTISLTKLAITSGALQKETSLSAPWMVAMDTSCDIIRGVVVCLDSRLQLLYQQSGETFTGTELKDLGVIGVNLLQAGEETDQFWLRSDHTHWLLRLHNDGPVTVVTKTDEVFSFGVTMEEGSRKMRVGVRWKEEEESVRIVASEEEEDLSQRVTVRERGRPLQGDLCVAEGRKRKREGLQLLLLMQDKSLLMIQSPGEVIWTRDDGLGSVVAVETVDLPSADQSGFIANFISSTMEEKNPLKLALMRLQLQFSLAKEFVNDLQNRGLPNLLRSDDLLIRDQFNVRKLLVVATATGKLYGIDSNSGDVIWQRFIPNIAPLKDGSFSLHLLRTTSHPPLSPLSVIIGVSMDEAYCRGQHVLYAFNPITGDHVMSGDGHMTCLGKVKQMMMLPHLDHTHSHILLYITQDAKVHTYPATSEAMRHAVEVASSQQIFFFTGDMESGLVNGYQLERNGDQSRMELKSKEIWMTFYPPEYETISQIITRSKIERMGSPGRVKADRSVQYKYLNPHLVAVVTSGHDDTAGEKPFFSVYLVDGITGATIHHTTHRNAAGPVNLILSDNWIAYHFYNMKVRRYELTVTELYDQPSNSTHSDWSSLSPPPLPIIASQSYVFPSAIAAMTTTQTKRSLTHRSLIMGLKSGHILSLPKRVLDPRRELIPTDEMREEGLPKYNPVLAIKPVMFINYNCTVGRLKMVSVATTGLESTSLVFASGLDLFFTRVTPSKQFDLLAEDFDYPLIATVVMALVAGTIGLSYFAKRKSLQALWK